MGYRPSVVPTTVWGHLRPMELPLVLGYLGVPPHFGHRRTCVSARYALLLRRSFILMPWYSRLGTFKPVPSRINFELHRAGKGDLLMKTTISDRRLGGLLVSWVSRVHSLPMASWRWRSSSTPRPSTSKTMASLQRGARKLFVNYCLNCHSARNSCATAAMHADRTHRKTDQADNLLISHRRQSRRHHAMVSNLNPKRCQGVAQKR